MSMALRTASTLALLATLTTSTSTSASSSSLASSGRWAPFKKLAKSDVPYSTMGAPRGSVAEAAAACAADPLCQAYNSKGELKQCAGCEQGC